MFKTTKYNYHLTLLCFFLLICLSAISQSESYKQKRIKQLAGPSPFQQEIDGKFPDRVLYHDSLVTVLGGRSGSGQAPVHLLAIPNIRIPSLNEMQEKDSYLIGHLLWALKSQTHKLGIDSTGYRISLNTGEDAGQSAFHIHAHLLGGTKTGPMVDPGWRNIQRARNAITDKTFLTAATKDNFLVNLMGIWKTGNRENKQQLETISIRIEPELTYNFLKLSVTDDFRTNKDSLSHYESVSILTPGKNNQYIGNGYDSDRNIYSMNIKKDGETFDIVFIDAKQKPVRKIMLNIVDKNKMHISLFNIDAYGSWHEMTNQNLLKDPQF